MGAEQFLHVQTPEELIGVVEEQFLQEGFGERALQYGRDLEKLGLFPRFENPNLFDEWISAIYAPYFQDPRQCPPEEAFEKVMQLKTVVRTGDVIRDQLDRALAIVQGKSQPRRPVDEWSDEEKEEYRRRFSVSSIAETVEHARGKGFMWPAEMGDGGLPERPNWIGKRQRAWLREVADQEEQAEGLVEVAMGMYQPLQLEAHRLLLQKILARRDFYIFEVLHGETVHIEQVLPEHYAQFAALGNPLPEDIREMVYERGLLTVPEADHDMFNYFDNLKRDRFEPMVKMVLGDKAAERLPDVDDEEGCREYYLELTDRLLDLFRKQETFIHGVVQERLVHLALILFSGAIDFPGRYRNEYADDMINRPLADSVPLLESIREDILSRWHKEW